MLKQIKILQIIPNLNTGGAEKICYELASRLNGDKFSITVLLFKDNCPNNNWPELLTNRSIEVICLQKKYLIDLNNFFQIIRIIKKIRPHIVHTHLGGDIYGTLAAKIKGVPLIVSTEHNINCSEKKITTFIKRMTVKLINRTWAVSKAVRIDALKRYKINSKKLFIIHNGIDLYKFNQDNVQQTRNNPIVIGSLGRLMTQKGFKILIKAVSETKNTNYIVKIAGEGPLRSTLETQIETLKLNNRIELIGQTESVAFFKKIDIFVISSLWEGLGLVALEAGAALKPIIASRTGGLKEVINENTGYLFSPNSSVDLAKKIDHLLENIGSPEVNQKIINNFQNIKDNFNVEKMCLNYAKEYEALLK